VNGESSIVNKIFYESSTRILMKLLLRRTLVLLYVNRQYNISTINDSRFTIDEYSSERASEWHNRWCHKA